MNKVEKYFSALIMIISFNFSHAQEFEDDARLWLNLYLEKNIGKHCDVHFTHSSRFRENVSQYGLAQGDIGVSYIRNKNIKVMADYVYRKRRNLDGSYSNRHRAYLAVRLKKELGRFTLSYRYRFQAELRDMFVSENGMVPRYYDRHKIVVKYELNKRFDAYVSEELFYPYYQAKNKGFDRSRSAVGLIYKLSKKATVQAGFIYQHELNAFSRTDRDFIYSLTYSYEF